MIITTTPTDNLDASYLSSFPDQFVSEKKKTTNKGWIKSTMDFLANQAYANYREAEKTYIKNYDLVKGEIDPADYNYSNDPNVAEFIDTLNKDLELPKYVKHYPILNPPLNEMIGGLSKRKNSHRAKALDDFSKSEEMEAKTNQMWEIIISAAQFEIGSQMQDELTQEDPEERQKAIQKFQDAVAKRVKDDIIDYTSMAEKWANHTMEAMRVELNMKEIAEEKLRDLLICGRMFTLIDEDNSKRGFSVEVKNPKNVTIWTTPDKKYSKDAYCATVVDVMEMTEIIEKFPELTKEEIDHLRESYTNYGINAEIPTNLNSGKTGIGTITYTKYSRLLDEERQFLSSQIQDGGDDELARAFGMLSNPAVWGSKFVTVRAYWWSKKLIKEITFLDEEGIEQTILVDENFKESSIPEENLISVKEGWVNQMYKGYKIGPDIYHTAPFSLLPYIPVIGGVFDSKNSHVKSLVDLMKNHQVLYNVLINQGYKLLAKDKGKVLGIEGAKIPSPKDGDDQDALDLLEQSAIERGLIVENTTPEVAKVIGNTNLTKVHDLDLSVQIQTRIALAKEIKFECWELAGFTRERLSSPTSAQTATANQNSINLSYTQTEPYYIQHRYVMNQLYQAIVDAAQYIESQKPVSTLSYINSRGESAFLQVTGSDIKNRDINVYVTSSEEDDQIFKELQALSQPYLQNGGDIIDVSYLYTTNSIRQLQKIYQSLKEKKEAIEQFNRELEQNKIKAQQQATALQIQHQKIEEDTQRAFEAHENELNRLNKKEVALIQAYSRNENALQDNNSNGIADALEITKQQNEVTKANQQYAQTQQSLDIQERARQDKLLIELQKIAVEREKLKTQLEIEKQKILNPTSGENVKSTIKNSKKKIK